MKFMVIPFCNALTLLLSVVPSLRFLKFPKNLPEQETIALISVFVIIF